VASISSVITGGFGVPGSASLIITDGYGTAGVTPIVVADAGGYGPGWNIDFEGIRKRIDEERADRESRRTKIEQLYRQATGQPLATDADIETMPRAKPAQRKRYEQVQVEIAAIREIDESIARLEARIAEARDQDVNEQEVRDILWIAANVI